MSTMKDKYGRPVVVITGSGLITSLGAGKSDNWKRLISGESGIHTITRFSTGGLKTKIAGTIDFLPNQPSSAPEMGERLAEVAIEEAISQSGLGSPGYFPGPLFLAVAPNELEWTQRRELAQAAGIHGSVNYDDLVRAAASERFRAYHERFAFGSVGEALANTFGTEGSPISLSTACASGATAIQLGLEAIRRGETDAALCVATDGSINVESLVRFSLLSALSTQNDIPQAASKPFSKNRDGFVMAEGAGAMVLENYETALARGAKILGVVAGCGELADSFHRTRASPDGTPAIGCIRKAIIDAGLTTDDIDYVNAHGTSTPENDKMEGHCVAAVLGARAKDVPMSSNKSMIGHTLSAAGAVEAVITLMTLEHQRIPPTINHHVPDPTIPLDVVPNIARDSCVRYAISNSFGFGGQNVSLVLAASPA
jgi:3-oxoacyl-[acyl-carrier-protein] synthase II